MHWVPAGLNCAAASYSRMPNDDDKKSVLSGLLFVRLAGSALFTSSSRMHRTGVAIVLMSPTLFHPLCTCHRGYIFESLTKQIRMAGEMQAGNFADESKRLRSCRL